MQTHYDKVTTMLKKSSVYLNAKVSQGEAGHEV